MFSIENILKDANTNKRKLSDEEIIEDSRKRIKIEKTFTIENISPITTDKSMSFRDSGMESTTVSNDSDLFNRSTPPLPMERKQSIPSNDNEKINNIRTVEEIEHLKNYFIQQKNLQLFRQQQQLQFEQQQREEKDRNHQNQMIQKIQLIQQLIANRQKQEPQTNFVGGENKENSRMNSNLIGPLTNQPMKVTELKKKRVRKEWKCETCGKIFDRPSLLIRHVRTHTGEKPHHCEVCGKSFSTSSSLNTHVRIHSGEKPHVCNVCGKRFTASSNLYYHRMIHTKVKPHPCLHCGKTFATPGDLKTHTYTHTGNWPFQCKICHRGFSKINNLKHHEETHFKKLMKMESIPYSMTN
ncbi:hypothetical protein SNEBB_006987 [Seison nebaliae]|nr:hypothetical protein SNEBB_006987 [Seison nebaliae]